MAITLTVTVGQVSGTAWNTNETLAATLNLRVSPYSVAYKNANSHLGNGVYDFLNVPPGEYKLYNSDTELNKYGIIKVGEHGAALLTANNTFTGRNEFTGDTTFNDVAIPTGFAITMADAPTTGTELVNKTYADTKASLTANQTFSGDIDFSGTNTVTGSLDFPINPPTTSVTPIVDDDLTRKGYVDAQVAAIVTTPFQESPNVIRVMVGGTNDTNKIYNTFQGALTAAASYAAAGRRYTIKIEGNGTTAGMNMDITAVTNPFRNYISVKGINQNIRLEINDDAYVNGTLGTMIVENVTIYRNDAGTGTPTFQNIIFKDVYFDFNTDSIGFTSCDFRGICQVKNTGTTVTINSNCKGGIVLTNGSLPASVVGFGGLATTDF